MVLDLKSSLEIILINTQLPENLGATARGMLNFNIENLRLVGPNFAMNNEKILPFTKSWMVWFPKRIICFFSK